MRVPVLCALVLLAACGGGTRTTVQDGSSLATALVLRNGAGAFDPLIAQQEWIQTYRPGARIVGQGRLQQNGRTYEVVSIVRRGVPEYLYFDITGARL